MNVLINYLIGFPRGYLVMEIYENLFSSESPTVTAFWWPSYCKAYGEESGTKWFIIIFYKKFVVKYVCSFYLNQAVFCDEAVFTTLKDENYT